jgi:hypothetical protein
VRWRASVFPFFIVLAFCFLSYKKWEYLPARFFYAARKAPATE